MKASLRSLLVLVSLIALVAALTGCGGTGGATVYLNLYQRANWQHVANGRLALASYGGGGLRYVYDITDSGGSLNLFTPSFNQNPAVFTLEGGWHPSYSPDGTNVVFVSERGTLINSIITPNFSGPTLYAFPSQTGDKSSLTLPLLPLPSDATSAGGATGGDSEPNWSPDGSKIIYSSTRPFPGRGSLRTIPSVLPPTSGAWAGDTPTNVLADGNDNEWPCYNPQNSNQIVYQSNNGLTGQTDPYSPTPPTGIFILDTSQPIVAGTNPHQIAAAAPYTDGAPSWSPDGTMIAFDSDRTGTFDIWIYFVVAVGANAAGTMVDLTPDPRSDGFPVWNLDSTKLAFTRDRELWTIHVDGTNATQLTKRFQ